ncbi:MAG TPA: sodium:proton antiporter [Rhizobium sp.]
MDAYLVTLAALGAVILFTAWLPMVLHRLPLSLPIVCIAFGVLLAWSPFSPLPGYNPLENRYLTERLTELVVIVALMGAGLKIDRPFGWRRWMTTWRLLGIAMPLTIAAIAFLGWSFLGLSIASALLLGASLAPTDPVLASDVQVGPPQSGEEDEVRFALTSEAGLNDGLSFPFVYLAIAIAVSQATGGAPWLFNWITLDVIWRLASGIAAGWIAGRLLGFVTFQLPVRTKLSRTGDGFVALGMTFLAYGATELIHGYGFVAVFVAALTLRSIERHDRYHEHLHDFVEQIERLLMMVLMVCFGSVITYGPLFERLDWHIVGAALIILFVIRPLFGWVSLAGSAEPKEERAAISFFGIRGLGSFYYLAFATGQAEFASVDVLWLTVFLVVLMSIVVHGVAVTPIMRSLDRKRRRPSQQHRPELRAAE